MEFRPFSAKEVRFHKILVLFLSFNPIDFITKRENPEIAKFLKLLKVFNFIFLNMLSKWSAPR